MPGPHVAVDAPHPDPGSRRRWTGSALSRTALVGAALAVLGLGVSIPALADGAESTPAESGDVAAAAHAEAAVAGTPCGVSVQACVDLESQQAWLIRDGKVVRGPMTVASGGAGRETPTGHSFRVYRKDPDHKSGEFTTPDGRPSPMPFSTFFADGGVAFHGGDPARSSAGCIRMELPDAEATFNDLQPGDKVQVVNASQERSAR